MGQVGNKLMKTQVSIQVLYIMAVIMEKLGALTKALSIVQRALTYATHKQKLYIQA